MRPEEYIRLRFGWLKRHIYSYKYEIDTFLIRDARQVREMEYEFYDGGEFRPLKKGDMYFTPDGTAFIEADFDIPDCLMGKDYSFVLPTTAEMMVKANGKYIGGIDPNRDRIDISDYIKDRHVHIEIEGYNRSKPDDERNPDNRSKRGCRQIFEGGYIAVVNRKLQSLIYDIEALLDVAYSGCFNEDFGELIEKELNTALNYIDYDDVRDEDVTAAAEHIDKRIFSCDLYKGDGIVELVSYSHLDIAYYWRRIHSVQKNMRTVLIQLRLMDKYPDFRYAHTQAYTYETLEKYYPEVFEEMKERIAEGRFEPACAMYVEPDCNIPSAESLIRQCLYGQTYFREKFGITVDNAWLPDVFGNSWILPQILKKSGVNYFVSNKMSTWNDTNRFPHNNFIWKGIDGSKVYACVPPTHFNSWNMPSQIKENWDAFQDKDTLSHTFQMFGYGDGGSGATEEMVELMHRFDKLSVMPETKMTSGKDFLHDNFDGRDDLAVWDGEFYLEMHRGTFTSKAKLKDCNRRTEFGLRDAELVSVLRMKQGKEYPADEIRDIYKKLMVNQFHDIMPGSHITPVYRDALEDFEDSERRLAALMGNDGNYFNTLNFERKSFSFIPDEKGKHMRKGVRGRFVHTHAPSLSRAETNERKSVGIITADDFSADTSYYKIVFNPDGSIVSIYDKELCREWVKGEFNKLHIYYDMPGNYDAWDILPNYVEKELEVKIASPLEYKGFDGECAEYEVTLATEKSSWKRIIRLFADSRGIEVENLVDWNESHKLAKVNFGCNVLTREMLCDTSAGFIPRETHRNTSWQQARFETCMHRWCDMSETGGGMAIINENKYGVGGVNSEMSLSLLRATERPDPTADLGFHDFCYMIYPHGGSAADAGVNNISLEYNSPVIKADVEWSGADFAPLYLQAVKLSEDGRRIVYRLSEQNGARGTLKLDKKMQILNMLEDIEGEAQTVEYAPFEIITLGEEI